MVAIKQLINDNYNPAANQFVINTNKRSYFQSYESVVAYIRKSDNKVFLARDWDYSNTTRKHLYIFFRDNGIHYLNSRKEVLNAIKTGKVSLSKKSSF